ncbi:uncharacterized protein LOC119684559 [Teleopsis dalmanni]|uniref:uncharacterized protein LOC119684559 n=1 Tax=Teleopsis dalmanni TaxID=139649 RepID=UPI0018CEF79A|nr:uncharacterized protein LOC119684559 [Teleopsis dalmanni]XP_037954547.1 uncharacterized protein LOC119684559 [Teleopsis dalmanni]
MSHIEHNGEPGCKTSAEENHLYRNTWDPTSYWECELQGQPAKIRRCKPNKLFSDKFGKCVNWQDWEWTEPKEPPSRP